MKLYFTWINDPILWCLGFELSSLGIRIHCVIFILSWQFYDPLKPNSQSREG